MTPVIDLEAERRRRARRDRGPLDERPQEPEYLSIALRVLADLEATPGRQLGRILSIANRVDRLAATPETGE